MAKKKGKKRQQKKQQQLQQQQLQGAAPGALAADEEDEEEDEEEAAQAFAASEAALREKHGALSRVLLPAKAQLQGRSVLATPWSGLEGAPAVLSETDYVALSMTRPEGVLSIVREQALVVKSLRERVKVDEHPEPVPHLTVAVPDDMKEAVWNDLRALPEPQAPVEPVEVAAGAPLPIGAQVGTSVAPAVGEGKPSDAKPTEEEEPQGWPRTLAEWLSRQLFLTSLYNYALIGAVVFCVYANSLTVPFLFDDAPVITRNRLFHEFTWDNAKKVVENHPLRAIPNLSFFVNYQVAGTPPYQYGSGPWRGTYGPTWTYHAFNMVLHAINGILLFLLLKTFLQGESKPPLRATAARRQSQKKPEAAPEDVTSSLSEWIALGAALLWVVHPIQTMAVTYIAQRFALFAAFGVFGSVLCYARLRRRMEAGLARWPSLGLGIDTRRGKVPQQIVAILGVNTDLWLCAGVLGFWVVGCASKENAAIVPWLLPVVEVLIFTKTEPDNKTPSLLVEVLGDFWTRFLVSCSLLPLFFGLLLFRYHQVGTLEDLIPASAPTFPDRMSYFRTEWVCILKYLRLWALPTDLTVEQAFPCLDWTMRLDDGTIVTNWSHTFHMLGALLCHGLILTLAGIWYWSGRRFLTLCVAWYYMTLAIESSILPILDPMVEHRVYIPSAMLAAATAYLVGKGAGNIWHYGPEWTRMFAKRLAGTLVSLEEPIHQRLEQLRQSVHENRQKIAVGLVGGWLALILAFGIGTHIRNKAWGTVTADFKDTGAIWRDTVQKRPDCARAYSSLGMEELYDEKWIESIEPIEAALYLGPYHVEGWNNIGKAYLELGGQMANRQIPGEPKKSSLNPCPLLDWARAALIRGIQVNEVAPSPSVPLCWNNLGLTYMKLSERVPKDKPGEHAGTDQQLRYEAEASRALAEAVKIDPGYETAWINLGTSYVRQAEKTAPGHEQRVLSLKAVDALKSSAASKSPNHPLFSICALNLALADRIAQHDAEAFLYLDLIYRRAVEDGAQEQVIATISMYAEEGLYVCEELAEFPGGIKKLQEDADATTDPARRQEILEAINSRQNELALARQLASAHRLLQAADAFAAEAEKVKGEAKAQAKYLRAAAKLTWFGGGKPERAYQLYDQAIALLPAGDERKKIEDEKSILMNAAGPPK
jgi:hypothetical protein